MFFSPASNLSLLRGGDLSRTVKVMDSSDKNMYFIIVENLPYPYERHRAGHLCYIEESRYVSKIKNTETLEYLPVKCFGTSVERDVKVAAIQPLSVQEAELLQALGEDGERIRAFREREWLDHALTLKKDSQVKVEVEGEWCQGVIRYIGAITEKKYPDPITGSYFGIELQGKDKGKGQCDGQFSGKRHFTCGKDCGVFAPFTRVKPMATKSQDPLKAQQAPPRDVKEPLTTGDRVTFFTDDDRSRNGMVMALEQKENKTFVRISPDVDEIGDNGESISIPLDYVIREDMLSPGTSSMLSPDGADPGPWLSSDGEQGIHLSLDSVVEVDLSPGRTVYGTVRWIGNLPGMEGTRVGLELEEDVGVSDGTFKGQRLFSCAPKKGLFVKLVSCRPDSRFQTPSEKEGPLSALNRHTDRALSRVECGTVAPLSSEEALQRLVGKMKGIQGHCNSCYMDSALFSLFSCSSVLDSLLFKSTKQRDAPIQTILLQDIVNPLRRDGFVPSMNVMNLRQQLQKGGHSDDTFTTEEKDPEEFLSLIMHRILSLEPLLKLSTGEKIQEGYCYQIFLDQNHSLVLPTVQQLLEHSFQSAGLRLAEIPSCLILQMPRLGKKFKMFSKIIPSLELDITDLLSESPQECILCGLLASVECTDCFRDPTYGNTGFKQFCSVCSKQVHAHPQRRSHKPSAIRLPEGYPPAGSPYAPPREKLQLFAVLCIETSHYVAFVRHGPGSRDWIFFDSMADRQGDQNGFNIPTVWACPEVGRYLEMPLAELATQVPREMEGVAKRLFCDAYMYLYQSPSMALYR
ncbi:hypothetical protein MATL_G00033130 [Megalops atlanticus]|uniref:Ubiquitin carboxyl-terminal hydrolase CYLD n=1 Tax=Megalops atlanticus TaxID=7932 RepID=A0A9D3QD51_MEGAT|nr:hypothetical protein MATL_G00033130 [Megalops atlanticus]